MVSRFPTVKYVDYCFHPIHVKDDTKDILVPCGHCDGCLLHKANDWSMRLANEIEATPNSIFFTLTYNNKYLPKLLLVSEDVRNDGSVFRSFTSNHPGNIRFNSVGDVVRKDDIVVKGLYDCTPIKNCDVQCINYSSKADIQLWLKLLRKWLIINFNIDEVRQSRGLFRYYIISEVGPTTHRCHYHGILFPKERQFAQGLIECGLYQNWQMCDKDLFQQYTHYCSSGAASYVTNYTTGFSSLPVVYQENKEIRPFRLASKSPAIGFIDYDTTQICQDVSRAVIEYTRTVKRLGTKNVLKRSSNFMRSLFPKCYRYGTSTDARISFVYGCLLRPYGIHGFSFDSYTRLLRSKLHVSDYSAAFAAYKYVSSFKSSLNHYLFLLDSYYYRTGMDALKRQYEYIQSLDSPKDCVDWYLNFHDYVSKSLQGIGSYPLSFWYFLDGIGLSWNDSYDFLKQKSYLDLDKNKSLYMNEVKSIIQNSQKLPKFNELVGLQPHIV